MKKFNRNPNISGEIPALSMGIRKNSYKRVLKGCSGVSQKNKKN